MDAIHIDSRHDYFVSHEAVVMRHNDSLSREWLVPLRCNFWIQVAYALLLIGPLSPFLFLIVPIDALLIVPFYAPSVSAFLFIITFGGKDSLRAYQRACRHIEAHGKFDARVQKKFLEQKYCCRAGVRLAAKDLGVAQELLPSLANSWRII
jgi:hypothetical protein